MALATLAMVTVPLASGCNIQISSGYRFDYQGASVEKSVEETIDPGIRSIHIKNRFGDVDVVPSTEDPTWTWSGTCWASDEKDAETFSSALKIQTSQVGDELHWTVVIPEPDRKLRGVKSNLTLTLPANVELFVDHQHGDIKADALAQNASLKNQHGDIRVQSPEGVIQLENSHGDVIVSDSSAAVNVICRHGAIEVNDPRENLTIESQHGEVKVINAQGSVTTDSAHTDIELVSMGGEINCSSQHGEVVVKVLGSEFQSLIADLQHGDITVVIPPEIQPRVQVGVQFGKADSKVESSELDSAPVIQINSQHGDITLRAAE